MNCPSCGSPNEAGRKFCGQCGARLAQICAACGTTNVATARFCGECGTALAAGPARPAFADGPSGSADPVAVPRDGSDGAQSPVAERRLVTVLFADLVGFTTLSDGRDPEDTRELLTRYFDVARDIIVSYGGSVEKFIGDAVMAVWGAPTAHEDDAERSVRAALDLVQAVRTLDPGLDARAGVLSGEAAVTLGAEGQGMVAGDLVNTASRLQSVAQPGSVLVGEATQQAASGAIAFEAAGAHQLKGKDAPVPAWRALRVVAQRRGRGREDRLEAPFVGRDAELRLLKDLLHATSREKRVRLVSITGVAGVGKSRLAWEFLKYVDGVVERVLWHEGRSPSYGEGITFWALGEMVRSRAGLLETDDEPTTRAKVAQTLAENVPDEDERRRLEPAILALLGVSEAPPGGAAALFGAWRTFFERLANQSVVALLFEDLQWADPGMLDFIDHMLEWSRNVPILIITLARPDLLERRPDWGAGRRNFLALDLEPLPEQAMRELLAGLVPGLPEPTIRSIVGRAEGIPLYAVETIRMLVADGRLREREGGGGFEPAGELGELTVPPTLHALIASRLDGLNPADRSLVQDAAVLGQTFTLAGLAAVAGLDETVIQERVRPLVRAELLRQEIDPRSPERGQYAFVQALIREVAYSTLAFRDRRARHLAAARFFESLGEDELAGALASHYLAAYRAAPAGAEADALAGQARLALRGAADRALALGSPSQAMAYFEQGIEVANDDAEKATLLERAAEAATAAARSDLAISLISRAEALRELGDDQAASARTQLLHTRALFEGRQRDAAVDVAQRALERFSGLADDHRVIIELNATLARAATAAGAYPLATDVAEKAIAAAERLGLPDVAAEVMAAKGLVYYDSGRLWEARAMLEGARVLAEESGLPEVALRATQNLALTVGLDDPHAALELEHAAIGLARRLGNRPSELVLLGNAAEDTIRTGEWDWAVDAIRTALQLDVDDTTRTMLEVSQSAFDVFRGSFATERADDLTGRLLALDDRDISSSAHDLRANLAVVAGDWRAAYEAQLEVAAMSDLNAPYCLPKAAQAVVMAGDVAAARAVLDRLAAMGARGRAIEADIGSVRASIAAIEGDRGAALTGYRGANAIWRDLGLPFDEAWTALAAATHVGVEEPEVAGWVETARETYTRLGARPMLDLLEAAVAKGPPARVQPAEEGAAAARQP